MRCLLFAKRNLKEILRDPLSLIFCLAFPLVMLLLFQVILLGIPKEGVLNVPQFQIERLAPSVVVFGFSFLTLFSGMLIAKDRSTSYLDRLRTSPLRAVDFLIGYTIPLFIMGLIQVVVGYGFSFLFGLKISGSLFLSILTMLPICLIFIGLGLILGTLLSDKSVGGISSLIVNAAAILGGMFMPLETMAKPFRIVCYSLPFASSLKFTNLIYLGDYQEALMYGLIVFGYMVVIIGLAILIFTKKLTKQK